MIVHKIDPQDFADLDGMIAYLQKLIELIKNYGV